jgi:aspartate carbamoyltransferase regulatory subunit
MTCEILSVSAIKHGIVIDHITQGQALKIVKLLNLEQDGKSLFLGLNLASQSLGRKDLIKVEDWKFAIDLPQAFAIFAPRATINVIENYEVVKKQPVIMPEHVLGILTCLNPQCISNHEPMESFFCVHFQKLKLRLQCRYCRRYDYI